MSNKVVALIAVAVVVVAGWLVYKHNASGLNISGDMNMGDMTMPTDADTIPTPTTDDTASTATGTVKEFTVSGGNFYFTPKTMTVNKGDTVKITFVNSGGTHNLMIDEFNVATPTVQSGQSATVTFVADKSGTFQYYCSIGSHRAMGMFGTLTVK